MEHSRNRFASDGVFDLHPPAEARAEVQRAFVAEHTELVEVDGLNRLVLLAGLTARLLRLLNEGCEAAADVREIGGVKVMLRAVEGVDAKDLKSLVDEAKKSLGSGVVAIACAALVQSPAESVVLISTSSLKISWKRPRAGRGRPWLIS